MRFDLAMLERVHVRVTMAERARMAAAAKRRGMTLSEYVRQAALSVAA